MLTVAIQSSAPPYLAVTSGPASHSPPPIAAAPMMRPGPSIARMFFQRNTGASGSSSTLHCGMACEPGQGPSVAGFSEVIGELIRRLEDGQGEGQPGQVAHHRLHIIAGQPKPRKM